jgi:hypothetical protein
VRDIANLKWRRRLKRLTDVFSSFRPIKAELNLRTQRTSAHSDRDFEKKYASLKAD